MNNKYFICYYLHTVLLKKMLIIHKFLWNQVKLLLKKIYITKPFTVYFRKLGLGLVLLWFVDDLLRGSNLQISCTHEFLTPFLKEMDFTYIIYITVIMRDWAMFYLNSVTWPEKTMGRWLEPILSTLSAVQRWFPNVYMLFPGMYLGGHAGGHFV